eukprot:11161395-Lingulodinium_polyedra.AAC.1
MLRQAELRTAVPAGLPEGVRAVVFVPEPPQLTDEVVDPAKAVGVTPTARGQERGRLLDHP